MVGNLPDSWEDFISAWVPGSASFGQSSSSPKGNAAVSVAETIEINQVFGGTKVEIAEFAKLVARWVGKNIVVDKNVTGHVNIVSPKPLSRHEAFELLVSALETAGFNIIENGQIIKIMKKQAISKISAPWPLPTATCRQRIRKWNNWRLFSHLRLY